MNTYQAVLRDLQKVADQKSIKNQQRFFKTQKGEYAHGDIFMGVTVPLQRRVARSFKNAPLAVIKQLLQSGVHEHRMTGLLILRMQFESATQEQQTQFVDFYLKHIAQVNNWDLVDISAPYILGVYTYSHRTPGLLYKHAQDSSMWVRRIAIVATLAHIKQQHFEPTIHIATLLISDKHDLIHKATGWMLREMGKRDLAALVKFLDRHTLAMPRTMLRYAIERLNPELRTYYLQLQ